MIPQCSVVWLKDSGDAFGISSRSRQTLNKVVKVDTLSRERGASAIEANMDTVSVINFHRTIHFIQLRLYLEVKHQESLVRFQRPSVFDRGF
jgi:hypothetical protein